ncbi:hypothetical protein QQF64_020152 [Cirrhinus molitorella]|uniref:Uncharacterized protein n=1 Tax=Cirrhinus molitorella TaxID=172907 RepID=A0ABR3LBV2_9TELE
MRALTHINPEQRHTHTIGAPRGRHGDACERHTRSSGPDDISAREAGAPRLTSGSRAPASRSTSCLAPVKMLDDPSDTGPPASAVTSPIT